MINYFSQFETKERSKTFKKWLLIAIASGFGRDVRTQLSFQKADA